LGRTGAIALVDKLPASKFGVSEQQQAATPNRKTQKNG
jgi:hypothetical protein